MVVVVVVQVASDARGAGTRRQMSRNWGSEEGKRLGAAAAGGTALVRAQGAAAEEGAART